MFHKGKKPIAADRPGPESQATPVVDRPWQMSEGTRRMGLGAWSFLGIAAVVGLGVFGLVVAAGIVVPFIFAALFGAVMFPLVDRLESWHLPRWVAALGMVVLAVALLAGMGYIVLQGLIGQWPQIADSLDAAVASIHSWLTTNNVPSPTPDQVKSAAKNAVSYLSGGVFSAVGSTLLVMASVGFGIFVGLNILFWIAKDGRKIGRFVGRHLLVPPDVGIPIVRRSVRAMQRYFFGISLIAALNGVIVGVGAYAIGLPLAATIGLVTFITAYVPYFGAIIGGAFAVLVALGAGGTGDATLMLIIVILANGPLQTVAQQFVLGDALEMHPLAIILITTTGGMLGGVIGGMFAAPFAKIVVDARAEIHAAGVFDYRSREATAASPGGTGDEPGLEREGDDVLAGHKVRPAARQGPPPLTPNPPTSPSS
jgi:predicted PurR-regulated permease PerM